MKLLLVSHGGLAPAILKSAEMILGAQPDVQTFMIEEGSDLNAARGQLETMIRTALESDELIVLSDLLYGTPFNFLVQLSRDLSFTHLTGMNLALVIDVLSNLDWNNALEISDEATQNARSGIINVNKLLEGEEVL